MILWFRGYDSLKRIVEVFDRREKFLTETYRISTPMEFVRLVNMYPNASMYMSIWLYDESGKQVMFDRVYIDIDVTRIIECNAGELKGIVNDIYTRIITRLHIIPFIVYSGCHGLHVYVFIRNPCVLIGSSVVRVYEEIYTKIISVLDVFQPFARGLWRRGCVLARVPYTVNRKCSSICYPVDHLGHKCNYNEAIILLRQAITNGYKIDNMGGNNG